MMGPTFPYGDSFVDLRFVQLSQHSLSIANRDSHKELELRVIYSSKFISLVIFHFFSFYFSANLTTHSICR